MTAGHRYSLLARDNLTQSIQMQLSLKGKTFSHVFLHFWNLEEILNIVKIRWSSQLMYFRNYLLGKLWSGKCLKSPLSEDSSKNSMENGPKHFWDLNHSTFRIFFDWYESNWVSKKCLLVICKIFWLFVNTLTTGHKFSLLNRDKLTQPIQMQLSKKQNAFSE